MGASRISSWIYPMEITSFKIFAQKKRMFFCSGHHLFDVQLSTDYTCRLQIALFHRFSSLRDPDIILSRLKQD